MPSALPGPPPPAWAVVAGLLAAAAAGWFALPTGLPRDAAVVGLNLLVVVALVVGARRCRPTPVLPWRLLAVGQGCNALAWAVWVGGPLLGVQESSPNLGDVLFVTSYVISIGVVARLSRSSGADRSAFVDAVVLATSFGVVMWVLVADPQVTGSDLNGGARVMAAAYPMLNVLLLAAAVPLVLARGRTPRALMLTGWVVLQLVGDLVYGIQLAGGGFVMGSPVFFWWLMSFALLAGAALHPSGMALVRSSLWWRRGALVLGLLPLPGLLLVRVVQGSGDSVPLIGAATLVVTLLAVGRAAAGGGDLPAAAERAVQRSLLRLAAAVVVFALLPLAALTAIAVTQSRATADVEIARRLTTSASATATHVGDQLAVLQELVASYASRPMLVAAAAAGDPAGHDVIQAHLSELQTRGDFTASWFVDADGVLRTVAPFEPSVVGRSFAQRDYFQGVSSSRAPHVSDAFATALPGEPQVVAVAAPVLVDGELLGAVVTGYRLDALRSFVERLATSQEAEVTLVDRSGNAVAGALVVDGDLASVASRPSVASALAGRRGLTEPDRRDRGSWTAHAPLPQIGWGVVAELSAVDGYAGVSRLTGRLVAAATLLGQVLLVGLLLQVQVERRRRTAEALLALQEEQVREILEAAGDAFVSLDQTGRVVRWNRQAEQTFGLTAEQALGQHVVDLVVPEDQRESYLAGLSRAASPTAPVSSTAQVTLLRAGAPFPAQATVWSTRDGQEVTFNAFVRDVTEQTEHVAELAVARDEALRASRMKSEFVANMSHEIRTPMNGVVGMTTLLLDTSLDDRQRGFVQTLRTSADALLGVINDVLDFSKIEAGKLDLEVADFSLPLLVEDVVDLMAAPARAKDLEIAAVVDPQLPRMLRGDSHRLRQVLTNLVGNAVKFTDAGEVVLEVRLDGPATGGLVPVLLLVRDTGAGIDAERQQQLFEAFTQADTSTTRRHGGTGLGLTISRQLVHLMGGELAVQSAAGRGSTFSARLLLPLAEELPAELPPDLAGVRVLVVDDSSTNRTVLEHLLARWEAQPVLVEDGAAALAELRAAASAGRPFDIALVDVRMPGMDGLQMAQQVADDPRLRGLPVVLLSSADESDEAGAPGVVARLTKPVREEHLLRAVLQAVGGEAAVVPVESAVASVPPPRSGSARARVLVVEDNLVNQMVVTEMLEMLGYASDLVEDGAAAVEQVRAGEHDVVLMDCQMPVMDGFEATRLIRALEGPRRDVPVVALTASALVTDRELCEQAGMDRFLAKPLRLEELEAVLDELLGAQRPVRTG